METFEYFSSVVFEACEKLFKEKLKQLNKKFTVRPSEVS